MNITYRIALIPGDGIGKQVVPEAVEVIKALSKQHGFERNCQSHRYVLVGADHA